MLKKKTINAIFSRLVTVLSLTWLEFSQVLFAQTNLPSSSTKIPLLPSGYTLQQVILEDSSVISPEEVKEIAANFIGQNLTLEDLRKIQIQLTERYIKAGYLNSFVQFLSQDNQRLEAGEGIVVYRAIESQLEEIEVEGLSHLRESYVRDRLLPYASSPLNVKRLESGLLLLQEDARIAQVESKLVPGDGVEKNIWIITIKEAPIWRVATASSNEESPFVGEWGWKTQIENQNIFGFGEQAQLEYKQTEGLERFSAIVSLPVTPENATVQFSYQFTNSEIISEPFARYFA